MSEQQRTPRRFGAHASVIQLLALFFMPSLDGGITGNACTLASLLFWACSISLLAWHRGCASGMNLHFLRWGLLPFVLIGTPLLRPVVERWAWHDLVLLPGTALLVVASLLYLVLRVLQLRFFDELVLAMFDGESPPEV